MADEIVGSARIRIEPDFSGFESSIVSEAESAGAAAATAIGESLRSAADAGAEAFGVVGEQISASLSDVGSGLSASVRAGVDDALAALGDLDTVVGIEVDTETAEDEVRTLIDRISGLTEADQQIVLSAQVTAAENAIRQIERQLQSSTLEDREIQILLDARGEAAASAEELRARLDEVSVAAEAAGAAAEGAFAGTGAAVSGEVAAGTDAAKADLDDLEKSGTTVADRLGEAFDGLGGIIAGVVGGVALAQVFSAGERVASIAGVTEQLLRTTEGVANVTSEGVVALGDELERTAGIESEVVQEAENMLLSFRRVRNQLGEGNDIFDRAIRLGADLSTVLGTGLSGSALQLGKALEDPVRGMNALRRAGVTFTAEQQEVIKSFVAQNDLLSAQRLILDEVEAQVGGAAVAGARASDIIRNSLGNITEAIGLGLLPAADELADSLPAILDDLLPKATEFGEALGGAALVAADGLLALTPLLGVTTDLLILLLPVLETGVDLLDAIPDPVLQGAAAVYTMNRALGLLQRTAQLTAVQNVGAAISNMVLPAGTVAGAFNNADVASRSLTGSLRGLTQGATGATLAFSAGFAALQLWTSMMNDARRSGQEFGQRVRGQFDLTALSAEELADLANRLGTQIEGLQEETDTGIVGRVINADFNAEVQSAADELFAFREEVVATREEALRLEAEANFGAIADSFLDPVGNMRTLREESLSAAAAVQLLQTRGDEGQDVFLDFAGSIDEAALSEEGMAAAAAILGTDVQSLQTYVEEVTGALTEFVDTAVSKFPDLSAAFRDANENGRVSAGEFLAGLQEDTATLTTFFANLEVIVAAGFTDVAAELATQGATVAGVATQQMADAARNGSTVLLEETRTALAERDAAFAASTDFLETTLGPEYVTASGFVAQAATEAFGANFNPEEQARIAMGLAETTLTDEGLRVAAVAATQGEDAAREFGAGLDLEQTVIEQAVAAGNALRENQEFVNAATAAGTGVGKAFTAGTASGMLLELQEVRNAAGEVVFSAADAAALAARIRSPSKLFAERIGLPISQGIAEGIDQGAVLVADAATRAITGAADQAAIDLTSNPGSIATGRALPVIDPTGGGRSGVPAGAGITIERVVLPTTDPELAAPSLISGMVSIQENVGVLT